MQAEAALLCRRLRTCQVQRTITLRAKSPKAKEAESAAQILAEVQEALTAVMEERT